jgi:hypothetical protein
MKLDSKYFDSIRLSNKPTEERPRQGPRCQWKGCRDFGQHRAPKGRGRDGEYYLLCAEHIRQFNAKYNYFDGMSDTEVEDFQRSAITGHRPTWRLGENAAAAGREVPRGYQRYARFAGPEADPHGILGENAGSQHSGDGASGPHRPLRALERRALETLHLPESATREEIKARFKEQVKRHHPDANGGDRAAEDKLREIIQAYNYLKQAGLV